MNEDDACDVAVVGAGLAGLTAGLSAAQRGARVCVIEQGAEDHYTCNSRYAGGWFHLAFHDAAADADWLIGRLLAIAPADVDHALIEAIARNARRTLRWLSEYGGARFIKGGPLAWHNNLLAPPRPPRSRLVWPGYGPDLLVRQLGTALAGAGGKLVRGHEVVQIGREGDAFIIACRTATGEKLVRARSLVMCDGGIAADMMQLNERVSRQPLRLLQRNAGTARGAGLHLLPPLGAGLTETKSFYGHLHSPRAIDDPSLWPYPTVDYLALAGIVVNGAGLRFIDDGRDGVFVTNELASAEDPQDAFAIFDASMWAEEGRQVRVPCNPLLKELGGSLFSASTLSELAAVSGINARNLINTINTYNAAVRNETTQALSVPKSPTNKALREIVQPPYFAISVCPGITHTMGGIAVSPTGAVQDTQGRSIPGLFAAGSTVGGAEGGRRSFYVGGLCKAATLGLICGEGAASLSGAGGSQYRRNSQY